MFYYPKRIVSANGIDLFKKYNVSDKDIEKYSQMIADGNETEAINLFIEKYVINSIQTYRDELNYYIEAGTSGEVDRENSILMYASVIAVSRVFKNTIKENIYKFLSMFAKNTFIQENITNSAIKNAILETTVARFNELVENAMSQTEAAVLGPIRDAQRAFIQANQTIIKNNLKGKDLDAFTVDFKNNIQKKIPGLKAYADRGLLLNSKGRQYQFDYYFDMATRTTALNIKRHAVEYMAETEQDEVLLYYLADNRPVKTEEREICKLVLSKKIKGYSFVALTDRAAGLLGIKTLAQVKADGGLGPWCRHGIKRVSKQIQKEILNQVA